MPHCNPAAARCNLSLLPALLQSRLRSRELHLALTILTSTHIQSQQLATAGKKVHVLVPDLGEYARSYKIFKAGLDAMGGSVTLGHLKEVGAAHP